MLQVLAYKSWWRNKALQFKASYRAMCCPLAERANRVAEVTGF
ncbi:MAG: hypothetical protein ACBR50_11780 [Microcoleus sp.]